MFGFRSSQTEFINILQNSLLWTRNEILAHRNYFFAIIDMLSPSSPFDGIWVNESRAVGVSQS